MAYIFEKYTSGGGSGGSADNGFFVIELDRDATSGTITLPNGLTVDEALSNPARFVFVIDSFFLLYKEIGVTAEGEGYFAYEGSMDLSAVNGGRVVATCKILTDMTYTISHTTDESSNASSGGRFLKTKTCPTWDEALAFTCGALANGSMIHCHKFVGTNRFKYTIEKDGANTTSDDVCYFDLIRALTITESGAMLQMSSLNCINTGYEKEYIVFGYGDGENTLTLLASCIEHFTTAYTPVSIDMSEVGETTVYYF